MWSIAVSRSVLAAQTCDPVRDAFDELVGSLQMAGVARTGNDQKVGVCSYGVDEAPREKAVFGVEFPGDDQNRHFQVV